MLANALKQLRELRLRDGHDMDDPCLEHLATHVSPRLEVLHLESPYISMAAWDLLGQLTSLTELTFGSPHLNNDYRLAKLVDDALAHMPRLRRLTLKYNVAKDVRRSKIRCHQCDRSMQPGELFCYHCGAKNDYSEVQLSSESATSQATHYGW